MAVENAVVTRERDQVMDDRIDIDRRVRGIAGGNVAGQRMAEIESAEQVADQPVRAGSAERWNAERTIRAGQRAEIEQMRSVRTDIDGVDLDGVMIA